MAGSGLKLGDGVTDRLIDSFRRHPLKEGEVRSVPGTGGAFLALDSTPVDSDEYIKMFGFTIDNIPVIMYNHR